MFQKCCELKIMLDIAALDFLAVFDISAFILLIFSNLYNSSYWSFVFVKKSQKQTNRPTGLYVPLNDFLFYFKWRENVENENFFCSSFHSHTLTYGVSNHLDNENLNNCIWTSIQIEESKVYILTQPLYLWIIYQRSVFVFNVLS